jgi:predicted lipid-binding transport protein (Tim44 family)
MNGGGLQLLVLAGIAIFLILKLKDVLGTRDGFEPDRENTLAPETKPSTTFQVIDGGPDRDIVDHISDPESVDALNQMKRVEPQLSVTEFLAGARGAYEMILMGFENGDIDEIGPFLSEDVRESFVDVIADREDRGLTIEANFIGVRELTLVGAEFDPETNLGEISIKFIGELTSLVRDNAGDIIEGDDKTVKRQKHVWTFARVMGADDPNWQLIQTGE